MILIHFSLSALPILAFSGLFLPFPPLSLLQEVSSSALLPLCLPLLPLCSTVLCLVQMAPDFTFVQLWFLSHCRSSAFLIGLQVPKRTEAIMNSSVIPPAKPCGGDLLSSFTCTVCMKLWAMQAESAGCHPRAFGALQPDRGCVVCWVSRLCVPGAGCYPQ